MATGVVAAAARGDIVELEARFGRELRDAEVARLCAAVPGALGYDPKQYSAPFANSADFTGEATVQVHNYSDASFAADVRMAWQSQDGEWRVSSVKRVNPK